MTLLTIAVIAACLCAGCHPDSSGDTQQMPATGKVTPQTGVPTANLPPQAQDAINKAAAKK